MFECILGDQVAVKGFRSLAWEVVAPGPLCAKRGCPSVPMPRVTRDNKSYNSLELKRKSVRHELASHLHQAGL